MSYRFYSIYTRILCPKVYSRYALGSNMSLYVVVCCFIVGVVGIVGIMAGMVGIAGIVGIVALLK